MKKKVWLIKAISTMMSILFAQMDDEEIRAYLDDQIIDPVKKKIRDSESKVDDLALPAIEMIEKIIGLPPD